MSASRQKGTRWETRLERWLVDHGVDARRNPLRGTVDEGDIAVPGWFVECKNTRQWQIRGWWEKAHGKQFELPGLYATAVVFPRPGCTVDRGFAVIDDRWPFDSVAWRFARRSTDLPVLMDDARRDAADAGCDRWCVRMAGGLLVVEVGTWVVMLGGRR